jgi:uncharacterized Zn-binding protein involved in type VI secretion
MNVNSGATYEHNINGGTVPTATWNDGSTCLVTGVGKGTTSSTLPGGVTGQSLYDLTWNCPEQDSSGTALSGSLTVRHNLTVVSTGAYSFRVQGTPITVNGDLIIQGGTVFVAGNATKVMDVGGNVDVTGGILELCGPASTNPGTTRTKGTLNVTKNFSVSGTGIVQASAPLPSNEVVFKGSADQTLTATGTISSVVNFTVNKSGGALNLGSNVSFPDTLKLTDDKLNTGSYTSTIASTGLVLRTSGYVIGNLAKVYSATGSKTFEVGTANGYSPVTVNATAGTGTFTVKATQGAHPNVNGTDVLARYWTLTSSGITTADLTFNYLVGDVGTGQEVNYELARYDGGSWYFPGVFVNAATHSVSVTGVSTFSDWTCGIASALPIQMASSAANVVRDNDVEVSWRTVSETNNYGFEIQRKRGDAGDWIKIAFVEGHGTTLAAQSYSYVDRELSFGQYFYRIRQVDLDGNSETFPEMAVTVGVDPNKIVLAQNYPNPFNPSTLIEFVVPQSGFATIKVYNVLGQEVASLFEGNAEAGKINTARFNASNLPSGLYFYTLRSAGKVETKRMLLMK